VEAEGSRLQWWKKNASACRHVCFHYTLAHARPTPAVVLGYAATSLYQQVGEEGKERASA